MSDIQETLAFFKKHGVQSTAAKIVDKSLGDYLRKNAAAQEVATKQGMIEALDITSEEWAAHWNIVETAKTQDSEVRTINWFIPRFEHVYYGGVYTLFRFAEYFQKHGIHNRIVLYDYPSAPIADIAKMVTESFPGLADAEFIPQTPDLSSLPESDATIATFWTSAFISAKCNKTKKKLYFIQDFEPGFYAANSYYALAESTYRMGMTGIVNTPGLADWIHTQYNMTTHAFTPAVNHAVYHITNDSLETKTAKTDNIQIVVYARPHHDRNGFELALVTCKKLKAQFGNRIRIVAAGDEWDPEEYGVSGIIENVGRLSSLDAVADLYRASDIGLVFMFTKHPSYQPFEYMACGAVVATNANSANDWFLQHNDNAIVMEPIPSIMVDHIATLITQPEERNRLAKKGVETVASMSWDAECDRIFKAISSNMHS